MEALPAENDSTAPIIPLKSKPKLSSIFCLLTVLGFCNTLDQVVPIFLKLGKFFNNFVKANLKNGKIFEAVITKECPLLFQKCLDAAQYAFWYKQFFSVEPANTPTSDSLYKITVPNKY